MHTVYEYSMNKRGYSYMICTIYPGEQEAAKNDDTSV